MLAARARANTQVSVAAARAAQAGCVPEPPRLRRERRTRLRLDREDRGQALELQTLPTTLARLPPSMRLVLREEVAAERNLLNPPSVAEAVVAAQAIAEEPAPVVEEQADKEIAVARVTQRLLEVAAAALVLPVRRVHLHPAALVAMDYNPTSPGRCFTTQAVAVVVRVLP